MEHVLSYMLGSFMGVLIAEFAWEKWLKDLLFKKVEDDEKETDC